MKFLRLISESTNESTNEIKQLFTKTFTDSEGADEGKLIGTLVEGLLTNEDNKDLHVFIALENKKIVACVFFSKMRFEESNVNAFLLSPAAVHTNYQGKGIGQKLINYSHNELKKNGVQLVITYGDINFYSRVGYKHINEQTVKAPLKLSYPEGWLAKSLLDDKIEPIKGNSFCVQELNKPEYW